MHPDLRYKPEEQSSDSGDRKTKPAFPPSGERRNKVCSPKVSIQVAKTEKLYLDFV